MPEQVQTPALIERHVPISAPPFFRVEYLINGVAKDAISPRMLEELRAASSWAPTRLEAVVLDYMAADSLAAKLGPHTFATTVVRPADRARAIAPQHRSQREDWRAQAANCGLR